jgi:DNA-binding FadR family transcriptional regulator
LHSLREEYGVDPSTDEVRETLQSLRRKGVVEVIKRTVPTYRRTVERSAVDVTETGE